MDISTFCTITLSLSLFVFFASIILGAVYKKILLNTGGTKKRKINLLPFHIFMVGFFMASVVMFYPVYYTSYITQNSGFVTFIKSVLLSVLNVLQTFFLNVDFDVVDSFIVNSGRINQTLGTIYTVYASAMYVVAPLLTFGFILSFFKDTVAWFKYILCPFADIYIFSELNERSVAFAKSVVSKDNKRRKQIVFADVIEKNNEEIFELLTEARKLGAVCFKKDITEISLKLSKKIKRKFYLIGKAEDENLRQALTLVNSCRQSPRYNTYNTQFYVFANSVESEKLLDSVDNGNMKLRRITEYRNLVLHTLSDNSLFKNAVCREEGKIITVIIAGFGGYGTELLKTTCWLGQMPGYKVNIHVFDKDGAEEKIKCVAPEFLQYNGKEIQGEPYYNIVFHDNVDVLGSAFLDEVSKINNVTNVYVALGNDELNIETAMKLRTQFGRDNIKFGKNIPEIYTIVYSSLKTEIFKRNGGLKSVKGKDYGIQFIGDIDSRYSIDVIEQVELEESALACHLRWSTASDKIDQDKRLFEKYEYYRKSSIAVALHGRLMDEIGLTCSAEVEEYEHKRWSAFMRSEGYIADASQNDDIAQTHCDLIPFNELSDEEKEKDSLMVSK